MHFSKLSSQTSYSLVQDAVYKISLNEWMVLASDIVEEGRGALDLCSGRIWGI